MPKKRLPRKLKKQLFTQERLFNKKMGYKFKYRYFKIYMNMKYLSILFNKHICYGN